MRRELLRAKAREFQPELDQVRDIYAEAEAEKRALTPAEKAICDPILAKGRDITDALRQLRIDDEVRAAAKGLAADVGNPYGGDDSAGDTKGRRLAFTKGMAAKVADSMLGGTKALAPSGATVVNQEFEADPIPLGRVATGLLDVLPVKTHTSPEYAFMRQSVRTNAAAVVAEGATKPTTTLTVARIEQSLSVIAHLSEGVPRYWLLDNDALQDFVDNELRYGLGLAVEAKVIADINGTSGIQAQAYSNSVLETLRKGITKIEASGLVAGAIALHPTDWETVELALSSTNAVEHLSLPYDPATRRLFGVPIATTTSQTAGTAHVLANDAVVLDVDTQGIDVQWSENSNSDDFSKNLIRARCEGRFGTSVRSLLGVVKATLTST